MHNTVAITIHLLLNISHHYRLSIAKNAANHYCSSYAIVHSLPPISYYSTMLSSPHRNLILLPHSCKYSIHSVFALYQCISRS